MSNTLENKKHLSEELNNAARTIADEHTICIIGTLRDHGLRFNELQRALNDINPTTLADRLKKLEDKGIVKREEVGKLSVVYSLTEKGEAILPIIKELEKFAQKFL
ncbi:MAG: helix-turn-helix domain-containing protein [Candidatus Dojkabacteria bacterium]|nr:MAG: helix-turn-helix domain-containing protein [Candidatus Dojkabacteria bacterium]